MRSFLLPALSLFALCSCSGGVKVDPGDHGGVPGEVVLVGVAGDQAGTSVAAGDVNGDGTSDLVVGAPRSGFGPAGRVHVVFGPLQEARVDLTSAPGFTIVGEHPDHYVGAELASVGDVNGDGRDDLLVAAEQRCRVPDGCYEDCPSECTTGPFRSYLVYGTPADAEVHLEEVAAGLGGLVIEGESAGDLEEQVFAPLGDLNADGLADFAISAPFSRSLDGRIYVVFGTAETGTIQLTDIAAGLGGYIIDTNTQPYGSFGRVLANAGDVNGDGLADLVLGDTNADENRGTAYVVWGKATTEPISIAEVVAGTRGFALRGEDNLLTPCCAETGLEVAGGGDVNGDGLADIVVTAPYFQTQEGPPPGRVYTVFGKADGATVSLAEVASGLGGGAAMDGLSGTGHTLGAAVRDLDGDGLADYLVEDNGDVHLVHGRTGTERVQLGSAPVSEELVPKAAGPYYLVHGTSLGDLDGNGVNDLALVGFSNDDAAPGQVVVMHR